MYGIYVMSENEAFKLIFLWYENVGQIYYGIPWIRHGFSVDFCCNRRS